MADMTYTKITKAGSSAISLPGHKWQCQAVKMKVINTIKWGLMKTKSTRHAKFVRDQTGKKCSMSIAVIKKNNSHNFNSI
jgi:cytochrome b